MKKLITFVAVGLLTTAILNPIFIIAASYAEYDPQRFIEFKLFSTCEHRVC